MRIIAGKFRGLVLNTFKDDKIRPTLDKVRQAVFTKLQFEMENRVVLDLFCGTGAVGIEALSRGAKEVVFVDKNISSLNITKQNLQKAKSSAKTVLSDYELFLKNCKQKFDLVFLDPPYRSMFYEKALNLLKKNNLLNEDCIVVCESLKEENFETTGYEVLDIKNYGTVKVTYLTC